MAGLTSSISFKPLLCRRAKTLSSSSSSSSCLCCFESEFRGIRLNNWNYLKLDYERAVYGASVTMITARYGGGYRPSPGGSRRRGESAESDLDAALDISSIRSTSVRLIDAEQNMVGIVSKSEAIQMAEDAELDLVILSPDADPPVVRIMDYKDLKSPDADLPVVRIMDYNKYRYDQQKKKREQQKKSAANRMDVKELKMGYNIDSHDYSVRLKAAQKFLKDGDKVKAIVNLKGRENEFRNIAIELIRRFQNDIGELATEEAKNFRERNIFIVLAPNKALLQKAQEQPKRREKPSATEISAGV